MVIPRGLLRFPESRVIQFGLLEDVSSEVSCDLVAACVVEALPLAVVITLAVQPLN